jgi:tetratricopeptide (TPR) repeat protein
VLCVSAADPPAVESLIRQADEAFAAENFDLALGLYEKAEALTHDPGRLSFNKAAAYYRLERYREAIESYRCCLEDDQAPLERRSRAWFQLGNALVQHADDDDGQLADAVEAYRNALKLLDNGSSLRADARHNLELAQTLLIRARERQNEKKDIPKVKPEKSKNDTETKGGKDQKFVLVPVDPSKGEKSKDAASGKSGVKSDQLQPGAIHVLPDTDKVAPRSAEQTLMALAKEAARIRDERRRQQNPSPNVQLSTKDW